MTRPARRITSTDVARAAGVSRTTVSVVLNDAPGQSIPEETRRRVMEAAERLGYRPHAWARALRAGRSDVALLAIPDLPIGSSISRFIEELATALAAFNLTLVTHLEGAHGRPLPDVCASVGASAVIGFYPFDAGTAQALRRAGATVVLPLPYEDSSMQQIGRLQAEHLIDRGHRRIGYALTADAALRPMADDRLRGVAEACARAGLEPPVELTVALKVPDAAQAVRHWTERSVTGVCAFNDDTALAVLAGVHERGLRSPADLAVIGADDILTAQVAIPPLTTVVFDLHEIARDHAESVVASLSGAQPRATSASARPRVIQRAST
ncbi:LacI family DNA-binding transcriptional regulator [Nonomuraea bangladeshensis]|uniref:LacI family DNA-binding transcriptional regulator n=1 Tax=Nonomuraea bangladeshensis TaxID=404385 RepID=UPI0031D959A4